MPMSDVERAGRHETSNSARWADLVIARRQRLAHVGKFIVRGFMAVTFCAAIGVAVAVLVRPPAVEGQLLVPASAKSRSVVNPSEPPSVEQVAAKVSKAPGAHTSLGFVDPSGGHRTVLVTLGTDQGRR
jgi:hypothetical protein